MLKWRRILSIFNSECISCSRMANFHSSAVSPKSLAEQEDNHPQPDGKNTKTKKKVKKRKDSHKTRLDAYFKSNPKRLHLRPLLPDKCFVQKKALEHLYLIDPPIANKVVLHLLPYLQNSSDQIIAECTPGLGLISEELLKNQIKSVRLYEPTPEFRDHLKKLNDIYPGRIELFTKDLFRMQTYLYMDRVDNGNRVDQLLRDAPKKSWTSDPFMTVIGPMANNSFIRHLLRALPMQNSLAVYGRIQMFLMMKPRDYLILTADVPLNFQNYRYLTILFNLFFDFELLEKFPREAFLPWEAEVKYLHKPKIRTIDEDKIYFARFVSKKHLALPLDQLMHFYFFIRQFFTGRTKIVPTLEGWVPGCGENIIWPKLEQNDYFQDISIHTEFGELSPNQIVGVFKEMHAHPSYQGSPFRGMIEAELIKTETIDTRSNVIRSDLEKNITADIEVNLDNS